MTELREKLQNFLKREEERLYGPEPDPEFFGAEREGRDSFRTGFVLLLEPLLKSMSIIQEAFDDSDNAALILSNGMDEIDKLLKAEEMVG